ncbi:hypothetical protein VaNZ11_010489 [Volvox africanus]|uniref:Uncharacterized protein n=1 Tax=Volvox africanus TaxID=51714 RepID=A0ABQ5S9P1_9CHLO|nr:hypothetical protein VaNZ11_010489 [Volvox africanus]
METTSYGGPRYEDQDGWPTLMHAQRTCLPEVLCLSCNGVKGELLGGHAAAAISIYVVCHGFCCHDRISLIISDGFNYSKGSRSGQANTGGANSSRGKAPNGGGSRTKNLVQPLPGPFFHLEDWYVHCNSQDPSWQPPNDLRFPQKADKLIKRSIQVVKAAGNGLKSGSGGEHMVALGDWMADFCRHYHRRGSSLVNKVVQVLWWNDIASGNPGASGYPFPYGSWYRGTVVSVSPKTGHLKVRFTDGEENEVAMGVNFVHFGNEHPTGDQRARLPPPLPSRLPSPQSIAAGRLAGQSEFTVSKASDSGCNSGYDRGRPSGRGSGIGNNDNILGECGLQGNSNVSGCNTPGSVLTSLRTSASQDGGNCKKQDPPSATAGKARGKGPALRKGQDVSCKPRSEGCGTGGHGKAASVVSPRTTVLTASTTAAVLSGGGAPPTKRLKVVAVGAPQLSGSKCGEGGAGSRREAPTAGPDTGPPACAVAAGPTGLVTTTGIDNNTSHATVAQSDCLPAPGLGKVSARTPPGTTSAPILPPGGRLHPSKRASVLRPQEHQQLQEQAALPPSPSPVVSTHVKDANAQSPKKRPAKRRRFKDAHCSTPVSEHAVGSHCGPCVGSQRRDSSAFTSRAKLQQDVKAQNDDRTEQVVRAEVMDTVSTGTLAKGTNTTTAGAIAGEVVVSSSQSSPGGCSQQVQWATVSHGAAQAAEPSSVRLAECLPGCGPPAGLPSGDGSTVVDRGLMEQIGGAKEYVAALEYRSREPSSRSCGGEAGLKMAREGDISGTADASPGNALGIEAQAAPSPPAAGEEAAATAAVASIAIPETQGGLHGAEHLGTGAETLTVPVYERQQLDMEWERSYAGGERQQFQSPLDTLPLPGGSEIALPPGPDPWPQGVPMELGKHAPQPQSLSPCIPGISMLAQHSLNPGLPEESAAPVGGAVGLPRGNAAEGTITPSTGVHNPVEAQLVHHAIVAPLPAQQLTSLLPREVDGAVAVPRPGSGALTATNPVPRYDELVAVGSIPWQGELGRCDSRGVRAGPHGEANARSVLGNPSGNNGASIPGATNKDGGEYIGSGDLGAGGHACQGFSRHGSSGDAGGAPASDYILAPPKALPPPGLSATMTSEWLAWWYVANSTGYGRQAADVLGVARHLLTNVQANFRATIEDCCRQLGCLPLHLRVLQVHYVQHAYMSLKRVPPEAGAKLANQLLLLIKLFLCETARETQECEQTAGLLAMATAAPPAPQPGALGGVSCGISGTVGDARHGQGTLMANPSFAERTRQRHPGPIQMAQQTHHSHQDPHQNIRGLTVEEFWELMAMCGSHCVHIIMIAIQSERSGQPIPKKVHDRLPSFPDLLRWAASAVPAKPAAAQASALQNPRQWSLLPRFQVTMIRLASRLRVVSEAALQQAPDVCQVNIVDALTAVPRCPLPPRPRQPASQEAHGQRQHQRQPQQPVGQSLRTDGDAAAGATPLVKCDPAPLREQQDPSRCHERNQNGLARVAQPWRISSRQLWAQLKRAGSRRCRRKPSFGSASEYESDCDGTSAWVSDPPTCLDKSIVDTGDNPNPQGAQQGPAATSSGLTDAGEVAGAVAGSILLSVAPGPAPDGAPQSCITAKSEGLKDLRTDMVTADVVGGPAGGFHRLSSAVMANGLAATPAVHAGRLKTSRTSFISPGLLLKCCRTILHCSKWGNEPFAVATAGTGLGVADQTPQMPDPATISCMDASSLSTIVRTLITRHIERPRPRVGTSSAAHVAAITSAGRSMRPIIDQASAGNVPASYDGEECLAGPTGLDRCLQEQQQPVSEPEMNRQMRLERVLAVWNALAPPRQRALYLVSCRLGMGPDSLDDWWAMDMVVKALESLADAMESRRSAVEGTTSGFGEV